MSLPDHSLLSYSIFAVIVLGGMIASYKTGKLSFGASLVGGILTSFIFFGVGSIGVSILIAFFILGTGATSWKRKNKISLGLEEANHGQRDAWQVLANAGLAAILGFLCLLFPAYTGLFSVMTAAAFAAATSDTLSSELGNIYGRRYYNILTLKRDQRGLNGVVSIEGSVFGILGATLIALIYCVAVSEWKSFLIILISGCIGNIIDSVLGASLERKGYLNNNAVNFINTTAGGFTALILFLLF